MAEGKTAILAEIAAHQEREVGKLKAEHEKRLAEARKEYGNSLKAELEDLRVKMDEELVKAEKQRVNSFELKAEQDLLAAQHTLYQRVIDRLLAAVAKDKKALDSYIKVVEKHAGGKAKKVVTDGAKAVAILSGNEEIEYGAQDVLVERNAKVYRLIEEELF